MSHNQLYPDSYYVIHEAASAKSAHVVLSHLYRRCAPHSVIDIGCGQGAWLAAAEDLGSRVLMGLDGPWVDRASLARPTIQFRPTDLERNVELSERYDLCISVEVAEHLTPNSERLFVKTLCQASDLVLFSAATPYQTGQGHVNLRWPSYWTGLFEEHHFECFDVLRPLVWDDVVVEWWYRQNVLLFARRGTRGVERLGRPATGAMLDVVHPEHLASIVSEHRERLAQPTLRFCLSSLGRWIKHAVGRLRSGQG